MRTTFYRAIMGAIVFLGLFFGFNCPLLESTVIALGTIWIFEPAFTQKNPNT